MKRILITGTSSYLGSSLKQHLSKWPEAYQVDTISLRGDEWKKQSFSGYDSVFHVAGIAHVDVGHVSEQRIQDYYRINTQLAVETAAKAKTDGVGQFIFMSSIIIYGDSAPIGEQKHIDSNTVPKPANFYGDTKLQAEIGIRALETDSFRAAVIRPPMIYGRGCKGNYQTLAKFSDKLLLFPKVNNRRSMLYIGNFVEFVKSVIDQGSNGIFWPQNREYVSTSDMIAAIAAVHGKKTVLVPGTAWLLKAMSHVTPLVNKAFGSLTYDMKMSEYETDYQKYDFLESIKYTEE